MQNKQTHLSLLMLAILKTDRWLTRREIGQALNRPSGITNPHDNLTLDRLVISGEIEFRERAIGAAKIVYEYRKVGE